MRLWYAWLKFRYYFNPYWPYVSFLYPLKRVSDVFRGYRNGTLAENGSVNPEHDSLITIGWFDGTVSNEFRITAILLVLWYKYENILAKIKHSIIWKSKSTVIDRKLNLEEYVTSLFKKQGKKYSF